jgi:hypothetical protein
MLILVSFAIYYGKSVGLPTIPPYGCWDTDHREPQIHLYGGDIKSRMDLYAARTSNISCWAQLRKDGCYDIYIGYA